MLKVENVDVDLFRKYIKDECIDLESFCGNVFDAKVINYYLKLSNRVLVAFNCGVLIAYLLYEENVGDYYIHLLCSKGSRAGVKLIDELKEIVKNNCGLTIILEPAEPNLIPYYQKRGFKKISNYLMIWNA